MDDDEPESIVSVWAGDDDSLIMSAWDIAEHLRPRFAQRLRDIADEIEQAGALH